MNCVEDIDIWRSANLLMKQHGDSAAKIARLRAAGLEAKGDTQGHAVWTRIHAAVVELQRNVENGGRLH